jgi:hypothetical protein
MSDKTGDRKSPRGAKDTAIIPIEAQVSREQLVHAAAQLPPEELEAFVASLLDLQVSSEREWARLAEAIGISARDVSVAALAARVRSSRKRILGLNQGGITTTADFDDALPDEFWLGGD